MSKRERNECGEKRETTWFVRDDPLADLEITDDFGHSAYTEVLAESIIKATPPFTFGVFGVWGVGKTTITKNYLAQALEKKAHGDIAYVYFDVWKYEDDSLRRQFLREVAAQLKQSKQLPHSYRPERKLEDLVADISEVQEHGIKIGWRRLIVAIPRGLIAFFAMYVSIRFLERFDVLKASRDNLILSVLSGILAAFAGELNRVLVVGERQFIRRSLDAPDLFEQKFLEIMNEVKADRLVIVIDNLDRCSPDRVIQVLSTIKTFLEPSGAKRQPIFVIPCDDGAIRAHLIKASEITSADANEYLRKFFNSTLRINPLLEGEIRNYVELQISRLQLGVDLTETQTREIAQIISVAFRGNPRRVKQFLNTLSMKLMIIRQREASGAINLLISSEVAFLAKLTVIEEEWPEFYKAIQSDARIYGTVSAIASGFPTNATNRLTILPNEPLESFLRGTRRIVSSNIRAFTRLKLEASELKLANYWEYRNALVDGRLESVTQILQQVEESERESYRGALIGILKEEVSNAYFDAALNVIDAAIRCPELSSPSVAAEVVEQLYTTLELRQLLPSLVPFETFRFLDLVSAQSAQQLVNEYLIILKRESLTPLVPSENLLRWQSEVAKGLIHIRSKIEENQVDQIRALASGLLVQNIGFLREFALAADGPMTFLDPTVFRTVVARLNLDDLELTSEGTLASSAIVDVILRCSVTADESGAIELVQHAANLFQQLDATPNDLTSEALIQLLMNCRELVPMADELSSSQLTDQLCSHYEHILAARRWQVISLLSTLYAKLDDESRQQVQTLVIEFANESPVDVGFFVDAEVQRGIESVPEELRNWLWEGLKQRFKSSNSAEDQQEIAAFFVSSAGDLGWEHIRQILEAAIDIGNMPSLDNALIKSKDSIGKNQPSILRSILGRLIENLSKFAPSVHSLAVPIVWSLVEHFDDENRIMLRDHVVKLASSEDAAIRKMGLDLLNEAEDHKVLQETERRNIAEQIVLMLNGRTGQLNDSYIPVFDRIDKDAGLLNENGMENMITALTALLATHSGLSVLAARYLTSLPLSNKSADGVLQELLHSAQGATEVSQQQQLLKYAYGMAIKDLRRKPAKAVGKYLKEIANGESPNKDFAAKLLGK